MKVLWCRLFGHKWRIWVRTHSELVWANVPTGFGMTGLEQRMQDFGRYDERRHCLRCGEENPMFLGTVEDR